jgi:hypothetical protein
LEAEGAGFSDPQIAFEVLIKFGVAEVLKYKD